MKKCWAAICDDEELSLNMVATALESCFSQYGVTLTLDKYQSSKELFQAAQQGKSYQVIFLDIDMPEMDGIELGVRLKKEQENAAIIYISNCEDRVFDSFQARPFGFVRKSSFLQDTQAVVKLYIESRRNADNRRLEVKTPDGFIQIPLADIVYIECIRDYQFFYLSTSDTPVKCRLSMTRLEETLVEQGFLRVHQGYIVNYAYIKKISNESIELTSGASIPMSRRKKQEVFAQYLRLSRSDSSVQTTGEES